MKTHTTVHSFQATKNQILGRLSQCTDTDQLYKQLTKELNSLHRLNQQAGDTHETKAMLIGHDITEGIDRANAVISGSLDDL